MIIKRDNGEVLFPNIIEDLPNTGTYDNLLIDPSTGQIGTESITKASSMKNIAPIENNSWLYELQPIQFHLKNDETNTLHYGIDAVSAAKANPGIVRYDENQQPSSVSEMKLIPVLVKELQNKDKEINTLQNKVSSLEERLQALEKEIRQ
jgi:hypothetical protein